MPPFRDVSDPLGVERELRLVERRRLDRRERVQWWLATLLSAWLLAQAATITVVAVAFDLARIEDRPSRSIFPQDTGFEAFSGFLTSLMNVVAVACCLMTFAVAAVLAVLAFWNRPVLTSGWFVAGVVPWLTLIAETAVVMLLAIWQFG